MTYRLSDSTATMTTDAISAGARIRRVLERGYGGGWVAERFGPAGVQLQHRSGVSIIVTEADADGVEWRHASVARRDRMPSWDELALLHSAAFGDGYAYQQFVPSEHHVSIHDQALHLWGRVDGLPGCQPVVTGGSV